MYLNKGDYKFRTGRYLSDTFPLQNDLKDGNALSPLLLNFPLEQVFQNVLGNEDGLKLNGTYQLLMYADNVNFFKENINNGKNPESLFCTSKKVGLEINPGKINVYL